MAMAMPFFFSPKFTLPLFSSYTNPRLLFSSHRRRESLLLIKSASAQTTPTPINVDYLSREFSGHSVTFESLGDDCAVKMCVDNGSVATMMLPTGLVTSYKPQLWYGSQMEVLQTSVVKSEDGDAVVITGGVSVGFSFFDSRSESSDLGGGFSSFWSPTSWALLDVKGTSEDCVQVVLISVDPENTIEIKYVVTLGADHLSSEVTITNLKSTSVQVIGFVLTHLKASTPDATYAFGLHGCNYQRRPPLQSYFSIIPNSRKKTTSLNNYWWSDKVKEEEESDHSFHMTEKFSRVYTCAPRRVTVLDRGRRNSVIMERRGFEEVYMSSPGSEYEWYGKYAYVCIGPSALLKPITLDPHHTWCCGQYLHNPNL